jgi:hypothetical protein
LSPIAARDLAAVMAQLLQQSRHGDLPIWRSIFRRSSRVLSRVGSLDDEPERLPHPLSARQVFLGLPD